MADIAIFRINYKSDFILTLQSDAGWLTPFCIKFWTGAPSQAYYAYYDGMSYTHCAPVDGEPTKLLVQFDDHHLPIGDLKFQIGYHFTVADFPTSVEDEVINQASVIIEVDDAPAQVMLDFNGETAPEIEFSLPAYANEAQRIANEQARIAAEEQRISNEQARISAEETRQANEQQRINVEAERVSDFASLKTESEAATAAANIAATLANEKAQLADDKAALAQAAATLANAKAQLAADKAALAQAVATLANEKAALAQQKAEYAQEQGDAAKTEAETAHALNEEVRDDEEARDQAEQIRQQQEAARQQAEAQRVTDFNAQMQQQQTAYADAEAVRDTAFDEAETERDAKVDAKVADITNMQAQLGYFVCDTGASVAAKTIAATGYVLTTGGNIRIKMTNANTADSATLNINSTGAKALFYNGTQASSTNSWEAGEVVEVYYDGNRFIASNSQGGGNLIIKEGENTHLVDFVDEEGNLVFYVDGDYVFHAIGNSNNEADDNEIPSKGLVKALINSSIEGIEVPTGDITMKEGDNNHLLDFCDEKGNLVFYVDNDFTFHALLSSVSLHLPSVINTYVGDTLQIFYYPLLLSPNYKHLGVNMFVPSEALNCKSLTRYAEYTSASAGTKTMKFNVFDDSLGILTSKDVTLNVVTPASPSSMKNILLIGDSETEGYVNNSVISPSADGMTKSMRYPYAKELMRVLTSSDAATQTSPAGLGLSNIQLIGHQRGDIRHEGYGGRSASWFLGTSSPFYVNGSIDFDAYLAQDTMYSDTSKKGVDYIYILLGANDIVAKSVMGGKLVLDATTYKNGMISLLDKIKSQIIEGSGTYANPNLKVVLLSYVISNQTGGAYHPLGQGEYGNGMMQALTYYQYYLVNNELSAMPDYADFVESVFVSHEVDSENAYAYINKQVNAYLSDTEKEYIENVHPNTIGYKMYGHAVARDILSRI